MTTTTERRRWGKAGVPLTPKEARQRAQTAGHRRLTKDQATQAAHTAWEAGLVRPYRITLALDAKKLYGPGVDQACGTAEPAVDQWEAGTLYPSWEQLQALADLCGVTPGFFMARGTAERPPLSASETSLRFHRPGTGDERPFVPVFTPEAIAATVHDTTPARTGPARGTARACYCGATDAVRWYIPGPRCPAHTPAALAGQPEPTVPSQAPTGPSTRPQDAPGWLAAWPARETGPCARCTRPCHRYGAGGGPLCDECRRTR